MTKIICSNCSTLIAEDEDRTEAEEIAEYDCEATFHCESDEWICADCVQAEIAYWRAELPILRAEFA